MALIPRSQRSRGRGPESGFLYIEALAATLILAFVLITMSGLFTIAVRKNAAAREMTIAATLAQDVAETQKRKHYATLTSEADTVMVGALAYDRTWTVTDNSPYTYMRTVSITVTPRRQGGHGENRVATITFYRVPA